MRLRAYEWNASPRPCHIGACEGAANKPRPQNGPNERKDNMATEKAQNLQDTFLNYVRKNKTSLTIFLVNGVKLQGVVTWFDNFCVLLRRDGHSQLVYKHAISTIMPGQPIQMFEAAEDGRTARLTPQRDSWIATAPGTPSMPEPSGPSRRRRAPSSSAPISTRGRPASERLRPCAARRRGAPRRGGRAGARDRPRRRRQRASSPLGASGPRPISARARSRRSRLR